MSASALTAVLGFSAFLYFCLSAHLLKTAPKNLYGVFLLLVGLLVAAPAIYYGTENPMQFGIGRVCTFLGAGFLPVVFYMLYRQYTDSSVRPWVLVAMSAIPAVTVILAMTNWKHGLVWQSYETLEGLRFTDINEHLWYKAVYGPYVYALFAYTWVALASRLGSVAVPHAKYLRIVLIGTAIPFFVSFANTMAGIGPIDFPFTAVTVTLLLPMYAYAAFAMRIWAFSPLGYRTLFNHVRDPIIVLDENNRILCANTSAEKMLGKSEEQLVGHVLWEDMPEAHDLLQNGAGFDLTQTLKLTEDLIYEVSVAPLKDSRGLSQGTVVTCRDVTQRRRTLGQLAENEHLIRTLIETSSNGILRFAQDDNADSEVYRCIFANPAAERFLSASGDALVGSRLMELTKLQPDRLRKHFERPRRNRAQMTYEFPLEQDDGETQWLRITAEPVGLDFSVTIIDITKRKQDEDRMMQQALLDPLTGVLNRRGFESEAKKRLREANCATVIYLDLNGFKQVNDRFGHQAGDALLKAFGHRLSYCLRPEDVLGRLGGDEFAIVLPDLAEADVGHMAERIRASGTEAYIIKGEEIRCSVSLGHALMPEQGQELWHLISVADEAMYSNKADQTSDELRQADG